MDRVAVLFLVPLLFGALLLALDLGRRIGARRLHRYPGASHSGLSAIEGAVFGLLGLMLAFAFSGAESRFETRRQLIVAEANAIGTAYLRIDLLPPDDRPAMRDRFRQYLDARLGFYRNLADPTAARPYLLRAQALQTEIWSQAIAECPRASSSATPTLVLMALNEMFDITSRRAAALETHAPGVIFGLLITLALISALLAGYGTAASKPRGWIHPLAFALVLAVTIYVVLDLEYPRIGLIRIDRVDQVLMDVRASMK